MQRSKSPEQAQRFLSSHAMIYGHFRPRRHLMTADQYRRARARAFQIWQQEIASKSRREHKRGIAVRSPAPISATT
jgi:putative transposase